MPGTSPSPVQRDGACIHYVRQGPRSVVRMLLSFRRSPSDILYLNSLFSPLFTLIPLTLWRLRVLPAKTLLLAPRGELSSPALAISSRKKLIVRRMLRLLIANQQIIWQATSDSEAADIRRFSRDAKIVRYDNPWPAPQSPNASRRDAAIGLKLVFLGRISRIKNPLTALDAMRDATGDVTIDLIGNAEDQNLDSECRALAQSLPSNIHVNFTGHMHPADVQVALDQADALILPTSSENFGHAIAEGLSRGCFILIPQTTPWTPLVNGGAGELITDTPSEHNRRLVQRLSRETPDKLRERRSLALSLYRDAYRDQNNASHSLFLRAWQLRMLP